MANTNKDSKTIDIYNGYVVFISTTLLFFYASMQKEALLKTIGDRIRKIRKEKGISQEDLAFSIGKEQQSIQRLEAGNINPSIYYLTEIAKGLDVSVIQLLEGI